MGGLTKKFARESARIDANELDERYGRDVMHRVSTQSFPPTKYFCYFNNNYR